MASITAGRYQPDRVEAVLDVMMQDAETALGGELPDSAVSVVRALYTPQAERMVELQRDLALILDSAQIEHAPDDQLDLLTALIGVPRKLAQQSTGTATFSRSTAAGQDYTIPSGTEVSTDGNDPIVFKTTESKVLKSGTTSIDAPIEAVDGGLLGNVAPATITVLRNTVAGIESVTNATSTEGGTDRERDDTLRTRAMKNLTPGAKASATSLITQALADEAVQSASIFINDTNAANVDGQPAHSFELVVHGPQTQTDYDRLAQMLLDTKAAGDTSASGVYGTAASGTAELINGQVFTIGLSEAVAVALYIDVDMKVTADYEGDAEVKDSIVRYVGGVLSSANDADGQLEVGDDVVYGAIEYAIRDVPGVFDINTLTVDTVSPPVGTSNIAIALNEKATADATDTSIGITTTEVTL